jgi:hypothetical protein
MLAIAQEFLRIRQHEIVKQDGGVWVRGAASNADALEARNRGRDEEPIDRRAAVFQLHDVEGVGRERERNFPEYDKVREQGVALAHRHPIGHHDVAEQLEAPFFA